MKKEVNFMVFCLLFLAMMHNAGSTGLQQAAADLKAINIEKMTESLSVSIEIEGKFAYQHFELDEPSRLVIQVSPISAIQAEEFYAVNAYGVKNIRTGRFRPDIARVVFDLAAGLPAYEITEKEGGILVSFQRPSVTEKQAQLEEIQQPEEAKAQEVIEEAVKEEETHLKFITREKVDGQVKVNIEIDGNFHHKTLEYLSLPRLTLDFWPIHRLTAHPQSNLDFHGVKGIDVTQVEPDTVRIAFGFTQKLEGFKVQRTTSGVSVVFRFVGEVKPVKPVEAKKEVAEIPTKEKVERAAYPPFKNTNIGLVIGSYKVKDELFDLIYGATGTIYGAELSRVIWNHKNLNMAISFGLRHFTKTGASTATQDETTFTLTPLTFSGLFILDTRYVAPFIGAGIDIYKYKEVTGIQDTSGSATGLDVQGGVYLKIPKLEFLNIKLYAKHTSVTAKEEDIEIALGGFEFGVGIIFCFDLLRKAVL